MERGGGWVDGVVNRDGDKAVCDDDKRISVFWTGKKEGEGEGRDEEKSRTKQDANIWS